MQRLNFSPYLSIIESLDIEEQIYINHESCPAGHDIKRRLSIKRIEDSYGKPTFIGYCHHCSTGGRYRLSGPQNKRTRQNIKPVTRGPITLPGDINTTPSEWPSEARIWLYRYRITDKDIARWGIGYSEGRKRVILPVYDTIGLSMYQTRRIFKHDTKPKYLTYRNRQDILLTNRAAETVVLVEDYLSAIRVGNIAPKDLSGCALFGTTIKQENLLKIVSNYQKYIVFLDDDNHQVKKEQVKLKNTLELFGDVRIVTGAGKDPKEFNDRELEDILI